MLKEIIKKFKNLKSEPDQEPSFEQVQQILPVEFGGEHKDYAPLDPDVLQQRNNICNK